ncbi:sulfate adenylyltransferase [Aquimarina sp. BL5]|uniref:sulfate adenylyltransferase subunit 1 n=1 Tax=Aquimarina sp. BL5 TaxID=1714860 RepID=UPI000E4D0565|nr:GTP-binding protein [Aquimarina sp. BL5]AXT51221.1 sulfate adenylyltransferase [Aquimarina sp. BL5]RKN06227.1 sulfate adenylyltransferase [Aquimarina sp. BL5]
MDVLKIATAGSVDDGKSTLIGRILYDTKSLTSDKLEAIETRSKANGFDYLDFSLATDGLVAEREQGITIDVAHIYFSTKTKSYIIADTPGHIEYTRNMVTGASTSQASIILVDARKGVIEQTYRHFFINNLLRVKDVIVAINKMDLVDFSQSTYEAIKSDFEKLIAKSDYKEQNITFIPVSALQGDNVVDASKNTPWYKGKTLLEHLEELDAQDVYEKAEVRFPVQTVIRPKKDEFHDFRGYAGKLYGGDLSVGDEVTVLPSLTTSKVKEIFFFDKKFDTAGRGSSCTITLEDDVNVSRGDMIVKSSEKPRVEKQLTATICWMDNKDLNPGANYFIQSGSNRILAKVKNISGTVATDFSGEDTAKNSLSLNEIGKVEIQLSKPLAIDSYSKNKVSGSFILIDSQTNNTSGVGFIQ